MRAIASVLLLALAGAAVAEEKKAEMPKGSWVRESEGFTLRMTFLKEELKVVARNGDATLTVKFKTEIDKEGVIKATVSNVEVKGDFPAKPENGAEMKFKFKVEDKKATLSGFDSKDLEHAKGVLEGEYESKAD